MNDRRSYDTEVAVLRQIIEDFVANDKIYKAEAISWREKTDIRLSSLEHFTERVNGPWKAVIFIMSAMALGAITHFSVHLFRLLKRAIMY